MRRSRARREGALVPPDVERGEHAVAFQRVAEREDPHRADRCREQGRGRGTGSKFQSLQGAEAS